MNEEDEKRKMENRFSISNLLENTRCMALCSYRIKMDENGAQECGMDFYAQFNSLKALEKKFLKSNHRFSLAVQSPASHSSPI